MYQDKQSLLNATTPTDDANEVTVRRSSHAPTHAYMRRRARNVALAREMLGDVELPPSFENGERSYAQIAATGLDVAAIFADPLPSGIVCAIPCGTGCSHPPKDDRMNEQPESLVDAIDAGSSQLGRLSPQVAYYLRNSRAASTRGLYRWAWNRVLRACRQMNLCPLPMSEACAAMVIVDAANDGLVFGSIRIIATVICVAHAIAKQPDPTKTEAFRSVMRGLGRAISHQQDQKVALTPDELRLIRDSCAADPNRARGTRDWAMVSFGFAGAFRRSEIVARNTADLEFLAEELRIYIDRSKTDQFGRGSYISIRPARDPQVCPIAAMRAWLAILPGPGPLFRRVSAHNTVTATRLSAYSVTSIVKGFGVALELPEDRLGAHSLRAGMITALIEAGVSNVLTMDHSRHKCDDTLRRYYRPRRSATNYTAMAGL
jgi:integrase